MNDYPSEWDHPLRLALQLQKESYLSKDSELNERFIKLHFVLNILQPYQESTYLTIKFNFSVKLKEKNFKTDIRTMKKLLKHL